MLCIGALHATHGERWWHQSLFFCEEYSALPFVIEESDFTTDLWLTVLGFMIFSVVGLLSWHFDSCSLVKVWSLWFDSNLVWSGSLVLLFAFESFTCWSNCHFRANGEWQKNHKVDYLWILWQSMYWTESHSFFWLVCSFDVFWYHWDNTAYLVTWFSWRLHVISTLFRVLASNTHNKHTFILFQESIIRLQLRSSLTLGSHRVLLCRSKPRHSERFVVCLPSGGPTDQSN